MTIAALRAAALTLAVSSAALAAPAQAQGFSFGFGFGMSDEDEDDSFFFPRRLCILADRGLRNAIADQGYEDIFLNVPIGRYVQARASRGDWIYLLKVDACTGDVVDRERLRRN